MDETAQATPNSDGTPAVTTHKVSVTFERKVTDGNYGSTAATVWVQGDYPAEATPQDVAIAAANLFSAAKSAVLDELGIEWSLDEQGMVREKITPFVSAAQATAAVNRAMPGTTFTNASGGIRVMNAGKEGVSTEPLPDWLVSQCRDSGITGVWDQRHTATGNQPHFREAVPRGATGHGKDGQPKGFWPPKDSW